MQRTADSVLVLNPRIREPDVPIVVRQVMFSRPAGDLFGLTVRPAVAVLLASVALVQEALIVALELVVQDDAVHSTALLAQALLGSDVGGKDLGVVRQLARLPEAGVEGLAGLLTAVVAFVSVGFQEVSPAVRQGDGSVVETERARANQSLVFQVPDAPARIIRVLAQVVQIALGYSSKGADGPEHAALGASIS